jgi:hypothetical protein
MPPVPPKPKPKPTFAPVPDLTREPETLPEEKEEGAE